MNPIEFYKCLADETRLKCLLLIQHQSELCVCELMAALEESQPKISRHLALLRKAGLLSDRKQAQWVFYQISPSLTDWCKQVLQLSLKQNSTFINSNLKKLSAMGDRPERQSSCCPD